MTAGTDDDARGGGHSEEQSSIDRFEGRYWFLSNFHSEQPFTLDGLAWPSVEHWFQAQKTMDPQAQQRIREATDPDRAKRLGQRVALREDWDEIRDDVMRRGLWAKFTQDPNLKARLLATGDAHLEEGNTWGDHYWGTVRRAGENRLGQLLMELRDKLASSP